MRKYFLPGLALIGALVALLVVFWSEKKEPTAPIPYPAPTSPYPHAIYGAGIIEASTENIAMGTPFVLPIEKIFVVEGDRVQAGDPLLRLDIRGFLAQKQLAVSERNAALVSFQNQKKQFSFYERLKDKRAVSEQAYQQAYYAMREAEERVNVAEAAIYQVETDIQRSTITAPVSGEILQVNAHVGEVYPASSYGTTQPYVNMESALILMGTVSPLQMRIDIDEEDCWRFEKGARATAFVRGNPSIHFPLEFVRIEPYVIPKISFTGETIERIDTRVLQVLYRFDKKDLPVYLGQLLDVYIESSPWEKSLLRHP